MPTEVHTICFHTRDAVEREDSRMVFEMPSHRVRDSAAKVAIGSIEFPMVQWTVEEEWRRLYVSEGVRLTCSSNTLKVFMRETGDPNPNAPVTVGLPGALNPILSVRMSQRKAVFTCKHPHFLWGENESCLIRACGNELKVIGLRMGEVSLNQAHEQGKLHRESDTQFSISGMAAVETLSPSVYLYASAIPSPKHLCDALSVASRSLGMSFRYNIQEDHVVVRVDQPMTQLVRFMPTELAVCMGLTTLPFHLGAEDRELPSGPTGLWDHVDLPLGFYGPCHRPMCTGQPMNFGTEAESALNRLYFPLPQGGDVRLQASPSTPHSLVVVDHRAKTHVCPIPCGRYTPNSIASHLERALSEAVGDGVEFSIMHEADRFVFSCERKGVDGKVSPCPFSILFNHPLCIDGGRFGFPSQPVVGSSTYVAPSETHFAMASGRMGTRRFSGLVRVTELSHQKRFRLHSVPIPVMTAMVLSTASGTTALRTYVNRLPYSHGFQSGDVVRLLSAEAERYVLLMQSGDGAQWSEVECSGTGGLSPFSCAVVDVDPRDSTVLFVNAPSGLVVGQCVSVMADGGPSPWNMCFSRNKPKGLDGYMLGFPARSILWGEDGTIGTAEHKLPPFESPHVHSLDHPDYVLITLSESSGANLEHSYGGVSKHVMCKLSLYPLFREERMLPRDTTLANGTFARFELAFWNPDMKRPYKFHGAEFSFSLNFLMAVPE